ncbi:hypothetical protein CMT41_14890 [Colwellia sp. MT41]|uniref:hypothetical protein n=1 Tax=Colwellia sp. MT41 TaxID=58049 RepID=UPI000717B353|nr:hypothetical protein [Colwellia sp. MT41]ALO35864.1 hypothetical protein CMT41_14890 [Colwellia sp. MT41]
MCLANFYGFAAGRESKSFCNNITEEIDGVDWRLDDLGGNEFTHKIKSADLVIIVANLNSHFEAKQVEFMVMVAEKLAVPILVYSLYPIKFALQASEQGISLELLDSINKAAVVMQLDGDLLANGMIATTPFIQYYLAKGLELLSINLILTIKAIVEPVTQQELIGVDFTDYCLAFANKGFYQTKLYTQETLFKAEVNSDSWLKAKVIIVTIFLSTDHALDVFSATSTSICNMLEESNALLLFAPVIAEHAQDEAVIALLYK